MKTDNFGFVGYVLLKDGEIYKKEKIGNKCIFHLKHKNGEEYLKDLFKEYKNSDFLTYNELLRYVVMSCKV